MAIGCAPKLAKCLLIIFNVVFWLSGLILIVIPSIFLSSEKMKALNKLDIPNSRNLFIGVIVLGCIIFVIAFCGCCGAIRESKFLLGMYIVFLMLIIIIQVAIGIFAVINKHKVEKSVNEGLKNTFNKNYGVVPNDTAMIDSMQQMFFCCGMEEPKDWENTDWFKNKLNQSQLYPSSCCPNNSECHKKNSGAENYTEGCVKKLRDYLRSIFPIFIGVILGIAFFEIFVVICAFCLCRNTGSLVQEVL